MFKNVATKIALFAFDTTTGAPKTGDAANITAYVSKDYGTVTVLGDTSATEMDSTNAKGWYLFDVAQAESNADALLFTAKSSTSNVSIVGQYIHTTPNRFSALVIDSAGLADATAVKVGPSGSATAQTAGDIPARLPAALVSGRIDASVGAMAADVITASAIATDALGALELAAGAASEIATAVRTELATELGRIDVATSTRASQTSVDTVAGYVDTEVAAIKTQTDKLTFTVANQVDVNVVDWKGATAPAMTGDAFARLGAPAGASVSADVAAIKVDTAAVKAKTDNLPTDPADASDIATATNALASTLATIAGYVDTEVAAIKAKTDLIPAAPAAVGDIPTATQNADALLKRDMSAVTGEADRSPLNAFRFIRNGFSVAGSTLTVLKEDDTTAAFTRDLTTDAAADPITGVS